MFFDSIDSVLKQARRVVSRLEKLGDQAQSKAEELDVTSRRLDEEASDKYLEAARARSLAGKWRSLVED